MLTENNVGDSKVYPKFVKKLPDSIERVYGDGAYDTKECYETHTKLGLGGNDEARKLWKKLKNYHRRSLGETAMFRLKKMFEGDLKSREIGRQKVEIRAKCLAFNTMSQLDMPDSY